MIIQDSYDDRTTQEIFMILSDGHYFLCLGRERENSWSIISQKSETVAGLVGAANRTLIVSPATKRCPSGTLL